LDGQLGDSRRRTLHDHLAICRGCRERVDGLRRFEADLQRRLRSMQHEASLWQPLGLETMVGTAPPPAVRLPLPVPALQQPETLPLLKRGSSHRLRLMQARQAATPPWRRLQGIAGAALLMAALAALADLALTGFGWLGGDKRQDVYRAYLQGEVQLDLNTGNADALEAWLAERVQEPVRLPEPPARFTLLGGEADAAMLPAGTVLAVYSEAQGPALLFIEARSELPTVTATQPEVASKDGITTMQWQAQGQAYSLLSPLPADRLAAFAAN
jgi:anti-sigma factor RsiW